MNIILFIFLLFQNPINAGLPENLEDLEDCGLIVICMTQDITDEFDEYLESLDNLGIEHGQAERSKREESPVEGDMRCSELNGNIEREVQQASSPEIVDKLDGSLK